MLRVFSFFRRSLLIPRTAPWGLILVIGAGLFSPAGAVTPHQVYFPIILKAHCTKDLVFLAFGDSITSCYMDNNLCAFPQCGYPKRLYDQLQSTFDRDFAYYNVGLGGERTADGLARLTDTLNHPAEYNVSPIFCAAAPSNFYPPTSANTKPDLIILLEGINDLGDWAASGFPLLEDIEANIRAMVRTALQSGVKVLLSTLTPVVPVNEHRIQQGAGVSEMNDRIRQIAADYQVPLGDVYAFFVNHPNWETVLMSTALGDDDGLHPNALGFAVMAEVYYQALQAHLTGEGCYK